MSRIHLIAQYYKVKYSNCDEDSIRKRQSEIDFCFRMNVNNAQIHHIHFLYECDSDLDHFKSIGIDLNQPKITLVNHGQRLRYSHILQYARRHIEKDAWCIYLHADMCVKYGFNRLSFLPQEQKDRKRIYALTSHNPARCNRELQCNCTRQFNTDRGLYGVTFDGFTWYNGILGSIEALLPDVDHIVHVMGAETRLIAMLRKHGFNVYCPNNVLVCDHYHFVKIFAGQHSQWITLSGEFTPLKQWSDIHVQQKKDNLPWDRRIVSAGIPFYDGSAEFISEL